MTELEKQRLLESLLKLYRGRIGRAKMIGGEFFDDFMNFLEVNKLEIKFKEGENAKS